MENLKNIFDCSSDNVIITDRDFNILWKNKKAEKLMMFFGSSCAELFKGLKGPLKSGSYSVIYDGLAYDMNIISSPQNGGIYVIQTDGEDVLCSFLHRKSMSKLVTNYEGLSRDSITGITMRMAELQKKIKNQDIEELDTEYLNEYIKIADGNFHKLLRFITCVAELKNYMDGIYVKEKIDLSVVMNNFLQTSKKLLKSEITIKGNVEEELYIIADADRLESFLIAFTVMVHDNCKDNNIILVSAKRDGDEVSLTFEADGNGRDSKTPVFSEHVKMYKGEELCIDRFIVNRFRKTFGGTYIISKTSSGRRSYSMKLPFCNDDGIPVFRVPKDRYGTEKYSKYNIMYSEILY